MTSVSSPIPYPDINRLLEVLLRLVQSALGEQFVGLYIYGSLAVGDFNRDRSDIDFLVATKTVLPNALVEKLREMHKVITMSQMEWANKLEGSYVPVEALRRYDPANSTHPSLRTDGSFDVDYHDSGWLIQLSMIPKHAITLAGPPPDQLIDPIPPEQVRSAARQTLEEWWRPQLSNPILLKSDEYQVYAVLTMCRSFYTLRTAQVVSKDTAAHWALSNLDPTWHDLIEDALIWKRSERFDRLEEVLGFIRMTLNAHLRCWEQGIG